MKLVAMDSRVMREEMPEAGKPDGLCEECGKHGNRGLVTLLWSVAPCNECQNRADGVAYRRAKALADEAEADYKARGWKVTEATWWFDGPDPDSNSSSWRRVARAKVEAEWDAGPTDAVEVNRAPPLPTWAQHFAKTPVGVP